MNLIAKTIDCWIQENKHITINANAPCAAYETVYEKKCPMRRGMDPSHEKKMWNGIYVDAHLEDKWLNDLKSIKGIEIRSSCEGHDKNWVAFVIFRFLNPKIEKNENIVNRIISNLESSDKITKASGFKGRQGRVRFVVAAPTWYGHKNWNLWWSSLANRIKQSIKN